EQVEAKPNLIQAVDVVISEIRFHGSAGANDDFIELYNPTTIAVNLNGWRLRTSNASGTTNPIYSFNSDVFLLPGQYFLLANDTYNDVTVPDVRYGTTSITDDGGVALIRGDNSFADQVGLSVGSAYKEVTPLTALATNVDRGYERKLGGLSDSCLDDGINSTDFQLINPSNPQNSSFVQRLCGISTDLQLTQIVSNPLPTVGSTVDFILTLSNNGTSNATNVAVKDILPIGLTYQSYSATAGTTYDDGTGLWSIANLNVGNSVVLTITALVSTSGPKTNIAEVWASDQFDLDSFAGNGSNLEDDYASMLLNLPKISGLVITNTVNNSNPLVGTNVIFTIVVSNPTGNPYTATNVNVSALLPAGLTYVSHSATQGTYTSGSGSGIWTIGNVPVNSSVTLTVTAKVITSTPSTYTSTVTSNEYLNNSASSSLNNPLSGEADLSINQSLDIATGVAGQVNLVISLKNDGPDTATGVSVRDLLPSGLTYVSHTATSGTYDANTGIWSVGNLANGTTITLTIKVKVAASGSSTNNTAQIWSSNQFDADTVDNSKSLEVAIADISILQSVDLTATTAIFTITVTNSGPDDATLQVKSNLPDVTSTYAFVSAGASQGTYTSATGIWNLGLLADGASATLVITTNTTGTLQSHIVEVSSSDVVDPDSVPNNKVRAEDDISGLPYTDLNLTQTVNTANPNIGGNVILNIKVNNAGPTTVTGVKVRDLLPSGLNYVSSTTASGSYASGTGLWTIPSIASGATIELSITVNVPASGSYVSQAEIYESGLFDPDSIPANGVNGEDDISSVTVSTNSIVRSVIINEVAWAGTTSSLSGDEWIELYNTTNASINITGWTLKAADGAPSITLNGTIPAGGYFLLEKDDDNTVSDILADQVYTGELSNSGETLTLSDAANKVIDTANGNGGGWPAGSSSTYGTMERTSTATDSDSIWQTNTGVVKNGKNANGGDILGTPKKANSPLPTPTPTPDKTATPTPLPPTATIPPRPIINEILARPGFDWNQDGSTDVFDEFIEIKNLTSVEISLNGWKLSTVDGDSFNLPDVNLKPGDRVVFYGKQTNILLSDGGETVRLSNSSGKIYDAFTYTVARTEDRSFCRLPDGNPGNSWFEDCIPTPNLTNTREGKSPTSPDGTDASACNLPDTVPLDFLIPECRGYGNNIWDPYYWDQISGVFKKWISSETSKWDSYIE
ncbi:MAG TPA: lamin tail domain-containing protein, partial [Anaerolineales bacterium]|nr:lamin tail domain-containing protein [Anaerolineales bacterium]